MAQLDAILRSPIRWMDQAKDAGIRSFLDDLQANILKGHGRHFTGNIFISFEGMGEAAVAALLRDLSGYVTSALQQLRTARSSAGPGFDGGPVRCLLLGAGAYRALGQLAAMPGDTAFQAGMRARQAMLADPPANAWGEGAWRPGNPAPDAMLLLANSSFDAVTRDLEAAEGWLDGTGARVLGVERGRAQFRQFRPGGPQEGVEHFGYVDGRSQPLFLAEDLEREEAASGQEPAGEVGLLFMAYMASIVGQFEFTQQAWANNPRFLRGLAAGEAPTGIDPVIGQGGDQAARTQDWPVGEGKPMVPFAFADFVRMQGGEYFFAPSRSFLREVGL